MYIMRVSVTIDPRLTADDKTSVYLDKLAKEFLQPLLPLGIECRDNTSYYCPDSEYELQGIDFQVKILLLSGAYRKVRSVACVIQIIQSLTALFDGADNISYHCVVEEVQYLPE